MSTEATVQLMPGERSSDVSLRVNIGRVLCVVIPIILWFAPLNMTTPAKHALAITSFMIIAWVTEAIEFAVACLIGCYLYWSLGLVPLDNALHGVSAYTPRFLLGARFFGPIATK